jgi:hypothetical protein
MTLIPYPNVPLVAGVPQVPRLLNSVSLNANVVTTTILGTLSGILWNVLQTKTQWGIYDKNGRPLGDPNRFSGILRNVTDTLGIGANLSTNAEDVLNRSFVASQVTPVATINENWFDNF